MTIDVEKHHIDYNAFNAENLSFLPYLFTISVRLTEMEVGS